MSFNLGQQAPSTNTQAADSTDVFVADTKSTAPAKYQQNEPAKSALRMEDEPEIFSERKLSLTTETTTTAATAASGENLNQSIKGCDGYIFF